jgi:hypothetical protein
MLTKRQLLQIGAAAAVPIVASTLNGALAQSSGSRPGFFKARDIAEEGFIYGLPIVMNYARHARVLGGSRTSSQYKAPFNHDQERSPTSSPTRTRR